MDKKNYVQELFKKRSEYLHEDQAETTADLLDVTATDIYTESHRFVFELIQNADDSSQDSQRKEVHFAFLKSSLIVSHYGKPFDENDLASLTTAGRSTKKSDPNKTGYKGIGFKSVFGLSKRVTVFSDGYQFRFDKEHFSKRLPWQIIPIWTDLTELPADVQEYVKKNSFPVSTIIEVDDVKSLLKDLLEIIGDTQVLLFLRWISKILVLDNTSTVAHISRKTTIENASFKEVSLYRDGKELSSWIVTRFSTIEVPAEIQKNLILEDKTPDKLKNIKATELSFAAKIDRGKIIPLNAQSSIIFTYLPTKVSDFEFPFLVNGTFLTNAGRETMHNDRQWNQWIFGQIAVYMFKWLEELATSQYRLQVLNVLRLKYELLVNPLKQAFNSAFEVSLKNTAFIAVEGDKLQRTNEVLFDKTGLSLQTFVGKHAIVEYANATLNTSFKEESFVHHALEKQDTLGKLGVVSLGRDNIEKFLKSEQLRRYLKIEQNVDLIRYLKSLSDGDSQGEWFQDLKYLPFIFDQHGMLRNPIDGVCFPDEFSDPDTGEIPTIHDDVHVSLVKDEKLIDWLKKLGVKTPSKITYVTNVIIPGIRAGGFITEANYLKITRYLSQLFKEQQLEEEVLESLRELPLKLQNKSEFFQAQDCYLADYYDPALPIEDVIPELSYVSDIYATEAGGSALFWNQFFRAIKVKDRIAVESLNGNNEMPTIKEVTSPEWVDDCIREVERVRGGFGFTPRNQMRNVKIPSFLKRTATDYKFANLFWKHLLEDSNILHELLEKATFVYGKGNGLNSYHFIVDNYFPWFIANQPCIPTSMDTILKRNEVYINKPDIVAIAGRDLPVFSQKGKLSDEWRALLTFKTQLSVEDCLHLLICIANSSPEDRPDLEPNEKRIGKVYTHLADLIADMSGDEKQKIRDWAATGKLLSDAGRFVVAAELKWIQIEGFTGGQGFDVILIPENCRVTPPVEELLELFQVQFIKKYSPSFEGSSRDFSLKKRLQSILPYYAAIVEKKNYSREEFDRLYKVIDGTDFYSAKSIVLNVDYEGGLMPGPSLKVHRDAKGFYFVGSYKSAITMFTLVPELASLFQVNQLNEELRLLLTADEDDLKEWMTSQGYDLTKLHAVKPFFIRPLLVGQSSSAAHGQAPSVGSQKEITVDEWKDNVDPELVETLEDQEFVASVNPKQAVESGVTIVRKNYSAPSVMVTTTAVTHSEMKRAEDREEVGRWAEHMVYLKLIQEGPEFGVVHWVNKHGESGAPYDLLVEKDGVSRYIDVKATHSSTKNVVYLSENEWKFMLQKGEFYSIYRVYNAGQANASIVPIDNPSKLLAEGLIFPSPITLAI